MRKKQTQGKFLLVPESVLSACTRLTLINPVLNPTAPMYPVPARYGYSSVSRSFLVFIHHDDILFIIHSENGNTVAGMIGNSNMLVIREDHKILRVITTDRKCKFLGQKACFLVYCIHSDSIFPCCCTEKIFTVRRKRHTGSCVMERIIGILFSKSGNALKQLKFRILTASVIAVYLHLIAELKKKICNLPSSLKRMIRGPLSLGQRRMSTSSSLSFFLLIR